MDLGLDILRVSGRQEIPLVPEYIRALNKADIELLGRPRGIGTPVSHLKRLTQRHHALARALASGMKHWEAALICGYTPQNITVLMRDPTFTELIRSYQEARDKEYRNVHKQMAGMLIDIMDSLEDDLEQGDLSPGQKLEAMKLIADRTGLGPATTSTHKHEHTFNVAGRVHAARKRLEERTIVDITPNKEEEAA